MSKIKNLIAKETTSWVEFPDIDGFEVELVYLNREDLMKIRLFPADISAMDPEENIEYDEEDALELLKNSTIFDQFITDCMNDYEQFSKQKAEEDEKN